jgi:hypothetical protein
VVSAMIEGMQTSGQKLRVRNCGIHDMTYKTPRPIRPVMDALVFLSIWRFQIIGSGSRAHRKSVTIVHAADNISRACAERLFVVKHTNQW